MNRQEENNIVFGQINNRIPDTATHNEYIRLSLATISIILGDISKSLAVIADSLNSTQEEVDK